MRAQASLALCFCALVTGAHNFLRRMESLHRNKGGASSKRAEPSEKEGMGLAVGLCRRGDTLVQAARFVSRLASLSFS